MEMERAVIAQNEPQAEAMEMQERVIDVNAVKTAVKKAVNWIKPKLTVMNGVIVLLCVFVAYCVVTGISDCNNYYMTPITLSVELNNLDEYDLEEASIAAMNGLGKKQWKEISEILNNSDEYLEMKEEMERWVARTNTEKKEFYGEDFKLAVTETSRRPLTVGELREYRRDLREAISSVGYLVDESEEFKSADWREVADDAGLTKDEAKKLIKVYREFVDEMEPVQVTEGYEVYLQRTITGELLKAPEVSNQQITVIKVNGRWVMLDVLETMEIFFGMVG